MIYIYIRKNNIYYILYNIYYIIDSSIESSKLIFWPLFFFLVLKAIH